MRDYYNDPPETEIAPEDEKVWEILEAAGTDEESIKKVSDIINGLLCEIGRLQSKGEAEYEARAALATEAPIRMSLTCPECGTPHIDEGEWATKPHKTHQCQQCKHEWRPFEYATVGVATEAQGEPVYQVMGVENGWQTISKDAYESLLDNTVFETRILYTAPRPPQSQPVQVPHGWKLVPLIPTQTMCVLGNEKAEEWRRFPLRMSQIWQTMLAAAPTIENKAEKSSSYCSVNKADKSTCQLHNLQCAYPSCIESAPHPPADTVTLGREEYEALQASAKNLSAIIPLSAEALQMAGHQTMSSELGSKWYLLNKAIDAARTGKDE